MVALGDAVKRLTNSIGIKPCAGCERRARALNRFGRRGFIGNLALLVISGRSLGRSLFGMPEQAVLAEAILHVRRLNAAQVRFNTINGRHTENLLELELPETPAGRSLDVHAESDDWTVLLTQEGRETMPAAIYSDGTGIIRKGTLSGGTGSAKALPPIWEAEYSPWESFSGRAFLQDCPHCNLASCGGTCATSASEIPKLTCFFNCSCCSYCAFCYTGQKDGSTCCGGACGLPYGGCTCNGNCHCIACP